MVRRTGRCLAWTPWPPGWAGRRLRRLSASAVAAATQSASEMAAAYERWQPENLQAPAPRGCRPKCFRGFCGTMVGGSLPERHHRRDTGGASSQMATAAGRGSCRAWAGDGRRRAPGMNGMVFGDQINSLFGGMAGSPRMRR